ncbi:MAG: hypothetical protein WCK37_05165 [Candidatus Falkowbacteria bacterium]
MKKLFILTLIFPVLFLAGCASKVADNNAPINNNIEQVPVVSENTPVATTSQVAAPIVASSTSESVIKTDEFSYSIVSGSAIVSREVKPFDFTADQLKSTANECGTKYASNYFEKLISKFSGANKIVYNFKYQGVSQDDGIFTITILPNKAGYTSLDQFKKDFDVCAAGGDVYPFLVNNNWLLFVSSCGTGFDDGSGRTHGCDEVEKIVEPSLKLN